MKMIYEHHQIQLVTCGAVCDRCGATQLDESETEKQSDPPPFVTVTVDARSSGDMLRGHFCPGCDEMLRGSPGAWLPYLRSVSHVRMDGGCRGYRFQVRDTATGELRWVDSLLADEEMM